MKHILFLSMLLTSLSSLAAVHVTENGTGQVGLVPFYTVANGLNTLLSINNVSDFPKALKVNIREAKHGDAIKTFNLYLDTNDTWAAAMVKNDDQLLIVSNDQSCTINLNSLVESEDYLWRNGTIEVIEMGVISDESPFFQSQLSQEENCDSLMSAWDEQEPESLWVTDPNSGLLQATGEVRVDTTIIDVENGFAFSVPVMHLDGFYADQTIFHTSPQTEVPNLSSGINESMVYHNGQVFNTVWPTGYEAISALIMKESFENDFNYDEAYGAVTDWVISFPTLRYHMIGNNGTEPFVVSEQLGDYYFNFPGNFGFGWTLFSREGYGVTFGCGITCPPIPINRLNHHVIIYGVQGDSLINNRLLAEDDQENYRTFTSMFPTFFKEGRLKFLLNEPFSVPNDNGVDANTDTAHQYTGLPLIGFSVLTYKNANAQPGLLAIYSISQIHYGKKNISLSNR